MAELVGQKEQTELNRYPETRRLFLKAIRLIPTGIPGHLGPVQSQFIPPQAYPFYAARAKGSRFWDIDGNEFIDYMCAYGPNVLGYNNEAVDAAAQAQMKQGNCLPLPARVQVELAELLVETIGIADWAYFAKNGGDVTALALMVARAATGRKKVILVKGGYHGAAPWTQKLGQPGITAEDVANNLYAEWNDLEQLERIISAHPGQIACFLATPYHHPIFTDSVLPAAEYWNRVEALCRRQGIVLAVDDVRCGFRLDLGGSAEYFGFRPDLACYCKALANGYNLAALVGSDALREAVSRLFYTGSYWSSAVPMAAAIACLRELKRLDGARLMIHKGRKLIRGLQEAARLYGFNLKVSGVPSMWYMRIADDDSLMLHQEFCAECAKRGVFFASHHNLFINCALTDEDINQTLEVAEKAFQAVRRNNPVE